MVLLEAAYYLRLKQDEDLKMMVIDMHGEKM